VKTRRTQLRACLAIAGLLSLTLAPGLALAAPRSSSIANPCPAGTTWVRPVSVTHRSDGGTVSHYLINGERTDVPVARPGFSPLAASEAELAANGLPPRPTNEADLATWTEDMRAWRRTPDRGLCTTDARAGGAVSDEPVDPEPPTAARFSLNWAGYITDETANTYIAVQGDWKQPSVADTICTNETEATWVGLGGYNTSRLIQAGTAYLRGSTSPVAWYEYLGANGAGIALTIMPNVDVNKADRMHAYVVIQRSTGQTTFYVADNTTSTSQTVIKTLSVSTYYDGTSPDFIDERLSYGGVIQNLYNFTNVPWSNTKVQNTAGTWSSLGSHSEIALDMVNIDSDILAAPGTMTSSTTFLDDYKQCG
jgi:hypothetical protein